MEKPATNVSRSGNKRIVALDYLRGFFVTVIIIDHLWKFPSIWVLFTGQAKLWVTAAEGFVMISGFLIGYIRGRKALTKPFREVATTLIKRSLLLYAWMVIMSVAFVAIDWYVKGVPYIPSSPAQEGNWALALQYILTMEHPHLWIFFLAIYAIFLALAVPFVWLLRKNLAWLAGLLVVALYISGLVFDIRWMKWQILFFGIALVGFYFDIIRDWWQNQTTAARRTYTAGVYLLSGVTVAISAIAAFFPNYLGASVSSELNRHFVIEDFGPLRILLSVVWFTGIAFLFTHAIRYIAKFTGGILDFIGAHSLSAYILHGLVICLINYVMTALKISENFLVNSIVGLVAILMVYGLLKIPLIAKIIPR